MFSVCDYVNLQMQKPWIWRADCVSVNPTAQPNGALDQAGELIDTKQAYFS